MAWTCSPSRAPVAPAGQPLGAPACTLPAQWLLNVSLPSTPPPCLAPHPQRANSGPRCLVSKHSAGCKAGAMMLNCLPSLGVLYSSQAAAETSPWY